MRLIRKFFFITLILTGLYFFGYGIINISNEIYFYSSYTPNAYEIKNEYNSEIIQVQQDVGALTGEVDVPLSYYNYEIIAGTYEYQQEILNYPIIEDVPIIYDRNVQNTTSPVIYDEENEHIAQPILYVNDTIYSYLPVIAN